MPGWVGDPREDLQKRLKSKNKFTEPLQCPFITHWLHNMTHDQVLDMLKYLGMGNRPEDKVKVILYLAIRMATTVSSTSIITT